MFRCFVCYHSKRGVCIHDLFCYYAITKEGCGSGCSTVERFDVDPILPLVTTVADGPTYLFIYILSIRLLHRACAVSSRIPRSRFHAATPR